MVKSNKNDFIIKSKIIWGDKYDYSLVEYVSAREKVKIIYDGWIFEQSPDNHLSGKKCEKTWNTDRFIHASKKIHGNKYDYSLVVFKNMNSLVDIILDDKVYKQTPFKHLMGRQIEKNIKLKTNEEFICDAKKIWGDKYDYSLVDYKGSFTPIKIIHNNIVYKQTPASHLSKMNCERDTIKDQDDFLRKAVKKHGNKYDYSLVEYKGIMKKVKIIFNGDIFEQKAGAHLHAGLVERKRTKKTNEEFIKISNIIHDFKYDYSKINYINSQTKVMIICPKHGEWSQSANSHLQGHGCPNCMESFGEKEINKFLNKYNIGFYRQHRFNECRGSRHTLPFDFYIPSMRTCIEYDGIQHYQPISYFGGLPAYESLKINDKIKSDYCEENYIDLIRIKYDQFDNIYQILWENLGSHIKRMKN